MSEFKDGTIHLEKSKVCKYIDLSQFLTMLSMLIYVQTHEITALQTFCCLHQAEKLWVFLQLLLEEQILASTS